MNKQNKLRTGETLALDFSQAYKHFKVPICLHILNANHMERTPSDSIQDDYRRWAIETTHENYCSVQYT